jgi:glycosyltransferase involved in cell wall biosynthesis
MGRGKEKFMKILHCVKLEILGGAENYFYRFMRFEHGLKGPLAHEILHTGRGGIHEKFRDFLQNNYRIYEYRRWKGIKIPGFARPYLLSRRLDFTHDINLFDRIKDGRLMDIFSRYARGKNVLYDHGHSRSLNAEKANWLPYFDSYFSTSHATKIILNKRWGIPEEKIKVIHNPISPDYLKRANRINNEEIENLRKRYGIKRKDKVILFVGRLTVVKGIHTLIEALSYLSGKGIKLLLVGDGRLRGILEGLVKEKGEEERVILAGLQWDTAPFYKMADVTVIPSARESLGIVNLESAVVGTPIIASKIDGIPEIISNEDLGYLLKPKIDPSRYPYLNPFPIHGYDVDPETGQLVSPSFLDPEELAETISLVLKKEPERAKEKAKNLKEKVKKEFSMERYAGRFKRLVKEIT